MLRLGDEVKCSLVLVLGQMAIDAIVTGVDPAADEPPPERRIARVQRDVPSLVPFEKIGVLLEVVGEVVETEAVEDFPVGQVGLSNEFLGRLDVGLLLPVNRNFGLGHFSGFLLRHVPPPRSSHG